MAKCRHCNKEYANSYGYCPYCGEPKTMRELRRKKYYHWGDAYAKILGFIIIYSIACLAFSLFYNALNADEVITEKGFITTFLILFIPGLIIDICYIVSKYKDSRTRIINEQFNDNPMSICPKCGSHSIKIYREGYDYNKGLWYSLLNVKGAWYLGGEHSNRARCHCMNCNNDWPTNIDYRFIQ